MTAAERVRLFLDTREMNGLGRDDLLAWTVASDHEEHQLTGADLRELLADNAQLRAQDREGQLRVAEAYRDAFGLQPWEIRQMNEQEARRQA